VYIYQFVVGAPTGQRDHTLLSDLEFFSPHDVKELGVMAQRRKDCNRIWSMYISNDDFQFYGCCLPCVVRKQPLPKVMDIPLRDQRKASFRISASPPVAVNIPDRIEIEDD